MMAKSLMLNWISMCLCGIGSAAPAAWRSSPLQLGAQDVEMVVRGGMDEADAPVLLADQDPIPGRKLSDDLAIAGELGMTDLRRAHHDLDEAVAIDDDRPVAERMRADGHDHERVERRVQDGPAAGEGIGGGTGGRGDDHAVGPLRM